MNPYQDVIDWLRSPEGSRWSERRMKEAMAFANLALNDGMRSWHLNHRTGDNIFSPLYLGGVLSIKEDDVNDGTTSNYRSGFEFDGFG